MTKAIIEITGMTIEQTAFMKKYANLDGSEDLCALFDCRYMDGCEICPFENNENINVNVTFQE